MEACIGLNDTCMGLLAVLTIKKQGISNRLISSDGRDKLGSNLSIIVKVLTVHFDGWKALPIIHSQLVLPIISAFMCTTINTRCMGAAVMGGRDAERAGCVADKVMRWTSGRRKHFHGVVESKA